MITEQQNTQSIGEQEVRFRCPHCQKLYRTGADVFDGESPEFDCSSCDQIFSLAQEQDSFGLFITKAGPQARFESCPKCSNLKPHKSDECPNCGVLASKYNELQKLESPALYELNQAWQKVMQNFDQDQYHQDFLNKCHIKMALNFAFQKYSELQKTMGFDALCEKYINQIELRLQQQFKVPHSTAVTAQEVSSKFELTRMQWIFFTIGSVGMTSLIYNRFVPTFPNFNGLVMMLTILAFGVGLFVDTKKGFKF